MLVYFLKMLHPQIVDFLIKGYSFEFFKKDLLSGLTVAIVAIPLSIAFAIASGATPIVGIFTAIIGGLIVSSFGGSKYNISGPAGAFIGVIHTTIAHYGYNGLLISTFLAGLITIICSLLKFGKLIKFIPNCIIIGFGLGLGIDLLSGQIGDFLGITSYGGENFVQKISACYQHLDQINVHSAILGTITVVSALIIRKYKPSFPSFFIAIIISCFVAKIFNLQIETIQSKFGLIHLTMPEFHKTIIDEVNHPIHLILYIKPAITIAILSSLEALLAATIADKMTNDHHEPNTELFSLGIANCLSALFGCIPIAGTTARTIVNVKSGAKSPFSGVFHGLFLIILIVIFADLISYINMPTMAGILFIISTDMMSFKKVINTCKTDTKANTMMMFFTAACVLTFGVVTAIVINTIIYRTIANILNEHNKHSV